MTQDDEIVSKQRPTGITLLSLLHFIGGALAIFALIPMTGNVVGASEVTGISPAFFILSLGFIFLMSLVSGIGMWKGKPWGWWLAGGYYAYSSIRNAYTVLSIPGVVGAGKRPEIEAFMLGTPKDSYIFPEEVDRARSAWSQAEELRRQGRELFKALLMLGGHEVNVGQATGMVGTTYTPGVHPHLPPASRVKELDEFQIRVGSHLGHERSCSITLLRLCSG